MSTMKNLEEDRNFFAKEVARKICNGQKMNAVILTTGSMGSGKSWSMLELAHLISIEIAKIKGDKPEDHFNFNENIGIMTMDEIEAVFEKMDKTMYSVFIIDDAGATFNSRRFSSDANVAQNDRLQTMRPMCNVVIYTTPQAFLIDKVLRWLATYVIYMKKPARHIGMNVADIRAITTYPGKAKPYESFLQNHRGEKYVEHLIAAPPVEWQEAYETRRAIAQQKLTDKSRETIEKGMEKNKPKESKKDFIIRLNQEYKDGKFPGLDSFKQVCVANKVNYASARTVLSNVNLTPEE